MTTAITYAGRPYEIDFSRETKELAIEHDLDKATISRLRKRHATQSLTDQQGMSLDEPIGQHSSLRDFLRLASDLAGERVGGHQRAADECGVNARTLGKWFSGVINPTRASAEKLLAWYNRTPKSVPHRPVTGPSRAHAAASTARSIAQTHVIKIAHDLYARAAADAARQNISVDAWFIQAAYAKLREWSE